jgi:hypothetical protein
MQDEILYNTRSDVRVAAMGLESLLKNTMLQETAHANAANKALNEERLKDHQQSYICALQWRDARVVQQKRLAQALTLGECLDKKTAVRHVTPQFRTIAERLGAALGSQRIDAVSAEIEQLLTLVNTQTRAFDAASKMQKKKKETASKTPTKKNELQSEVTTVAELESTMQRLSHQLVCESVDVLRRRSSSGGSRQSDEIVV